MRKLGTVLILTALVAGLSACGHHQKYHETDLQDPKSFMAHFPDMDTDGDDLVSAAEFKTYFPDADDNVYKALDLNADGSVDHDEWHEFKLAHGLETHE